ncbi:peptidoglycan DD-metalloendopeptidase family protein [Phytohabitans flavus]|uniref:M23 family metallopeptidase n=1 Tax=Phytohabitans flavus TaxID=1076124 RepID=UPI00362A545B
MFQLPFPCGESWKLQTYKGHDDYDIDMYANSGGTAGRPIVASYGGTVQSSGFDNGGGWHVKINHGNGWQTLYLHMNAQPLVSVGQTVVMGQQLGNVGKTGAAGDTYHLHYEQLADGNKTESWFNGVPSGITSDGSAGTGPIYVEGPISGPVNVTSSNGCAPRPRPSPPVRSSGTASCMSSPEGLTTSSTTGSPVVAGGRPPRPSTGRSPATPSPPSTTEFCTCSPSAPMAPSSTGSPAALGGRPPKASAVGPVAR